MSKINLKFSSFSSGVISPRLLGNTESSSYLTGLSEGRNFLVGNYGFLTSRGGTQYINEVKASATKSYLIPLVYPNQDSYMLEFTTNKIRFYKNKAVILDMGLPYEVTTTYAVADIPNIRYVRVFDSVYIVCAGYPVKKLQRISDTNWTFGDVTFDEPAWQEENDTTKTLTFSAVTGSGVTCTASAATFAATDVGRHIRFKSGPDDEDGLLYISPGAAQKFFDIGFSPRTSSTVEVFRIESTGARTELTFNAGVLGANEFKITSGQVEIAAALTAGQTLLVQRKYTSTGQWGYAIITGYTSSTVVTVTIINQIGGTNPSVYWKLGAWSATTGYPTKITFYQQRLWFASTTAQPNAVWASGIQDFENFSEDDVFNFGTPIASSSISAEIDGIGSINWIGISGDVLLVGGDGLKSIGKGGAVIAGNDILPVRPESSILVKNMDAISTKNEIIFAENAGKFLHSAMFDFQSNSFNTVNLNTLSDQLFEVSGIKKIVFSENPYPIIWILKNDGTLVAMTYDKTLKVIGAMDQVIAGTNCEVEDIGVIPSTSESQVWMIVKRTIDGGTKRYIECLDFHFYNDTIEESKFVDSFLVYSGTAATTISGLDHLEGETVHIIADGGVVEGKVVTSGEIILDTAAEYVIIGLRPSRYLVGCPVAVGTGSGTTRGSEAKVRKLVVDLFETASCKLSVDGEEGVDINFRGTDFVGLQPNELYSGVKEEHIENDYSTDLKWRIDEVSGLPCTIRSVIVKLEVSGE